MSKHLVPAGDGIMRITLTVTAGAPHGGGVYLFGPHTFLLGRSERGPLPPPPHGRCFSPLPPQPAPPRAPRAAAPPGVQITRPPGAPDPQPPSGLPDRPPESVAGACLVCAAPAASAEHGARGSPAETDSLPLCPACRAEV